MSPIGAIGDKMLNFLSRSGLPLTLHKRDVGELVGYIHLWKPQSHLGGDDVILRLVSGS